MKHIALPDERCRRLPFYLALEEWVARALPADDYFFTWIVGPTVIIGRNQDLETEVNLEYCRENDIAVYRRRSGGGCVFADYNNIMISFVTPSPDVVTTFGSYTGRVAARLREMGIDARAGGRNDIMVDGRKISGNAFYHLPGRSIVHGTMLYDTDVRHMLNAITPSRAKLESKQVTSVQSRIVTARELMPSLTLADFHAGLVAGLGDSEYVLSPDDIRAVEAIEANYYRPEWLYGRRRGAAVRYEHRKRIDGVGEIAATVSLNGTGRIAGIDLTGDFFMTADLDAGILDRLHGVPPTAAALAEALAGVKVADTIPGLSAAQLIDILKSA